MTSEDSYLLEFELGEVISDTTFIHQIDSGTIFFRENDVLWLQYEGAKTEVKLLGGFRNSMMAAQGDSIYYGSNWKRKIYRAVFKPPGQIETYYVRDLIKGENIHQGGMCSIVKNEKLFVYRMCDDPIRDRIHIDVPKDTLEWAELKGLHGGKAIFRHITNQSILPSVKQMGTNGVLLSCFRGTPRRFLELLNSRNDMTEYYAPWGSPAVNYGAYVYMTNGTSLFVIGPVEVKMLPPLHFQNVSCFHIAGIHEGILVGRAKCKKTGKYRLVTTELPYDYMMEARPVLTTYSERTTIPIDDRSIEFTSKFLTEFTVKSIRGEGAFGCVFEAVNNYDEWEYAVKRVAVDVGAVKFALNEVKAMAKLNHPNIIGYNSTWVETPPKGWQVDADLELLQKLGSTKRFIGKFNDGCAFIYIQMQLAKLSLSDWLHKHQDQSDRKLQRMKAWFKQIVCAVDYIHKEGLIHRDLKPNNILIVEANHLKLCDLGVARERKFDEGPDTGISGTWGGTMLYMSPEQVRCLLRSRNSMILGHQSTDKSCFNEVINLLSRKQPIHVIFKAFRYSSKSDVFTLGLILAELCLVMSESARWEVFLIWKVAL
ncbi:hypothetical protein PMAYCL1PPCAC_08486 [Pristionchus mayeri]|uniref:Protein kinase domain-containing protein n=1 Tax=Pristionchus mayeri TaxID=1317129 RepID=A0AAN4ZFQ8_9BILA|nr:hypothetical protein PMAYCL1PPCAC_08481 [Pristionchus mayeri]GMR38291.1 hypothetical protein PMAYCL1PPCAC_08486 [Pristionchus mayeri]